MGTTNDPSLRGEHLNGSDQPDAVDHTENTKKQNADTKLRLDGEADTLYDDGLDVEDDSETLADTHRERGTGA